jgi:hypothetical protein
MIRNLLNVPQEPGQHSRFSDWLQAGRQRGRSSVPVDSRIFSSPRYQDGSEVLSNGYQELVLRE